MKRKVSFFRVFVLGFIIALIIYSIHLGWNGVAICLSLILALYLCLAILGPGAKYDEAMERWYWEMERRSKERRLKQRT